MRTAKKRGKNLQKLERVIEKIVQRLPLEKIYRDHSLIGDWDGHRDLHIEPDWLLIYKLVDEENKVIFTRTGTHSDLFR